MSNLSKYILCFFIVSSALLFSQTTPKQRDLKSVLIELESQFNITFSYADVTLKDIAVTVPKDTLTLSEYLKNFTRQTGLKFNILNDRFIAITKNRNSYDLQQLDEVFIKNYLTKGLSKPIDGSVKIAPQRFGILPGLSEPDIFQTIQTLPGVLSADERISNVNIRGGTNDQNLVLYEGIRMFQNGHFFGLISAFNPYLTDEVNVIINGTPTRYGSGVSSLISIINSNEISNSASSGAGFNLLSIDGFSKFQTSNKTEFQISARRSYTDALLTPTYDNYLERVFQNSALENLYQNQQADFKANERFFFYDANVKVLHNFNEKNKIRGNVLTFFNRLNYNVIAPQNNTGQSTSSELSQQSIAGNIQYLKKWSPSTSVEAQIYFSTYKLLGNNSIIENGLSITQENNVNDLGIRAHFLNRVDTNLNVNFGYQFNNVSTSNLEDITTPNFKRFIREVVSTHGIYGEAEFTSNSKNTYGRLGLRGNYISDFSTILFEPRFSFSQKFLNFFRLEFLGEVKSQTISQIIDLQQDFFGIEKRRWQLSNNENFPVIKSNQISFGLNYKRNGLLITAEVYNKNVNGVNTRTQGFQNQFQLVEGTGNYNIKGIDILFNKQFKNFSTWLSYSYSDNDFEFKDGSNNILFPNNIDIQHVINISSAYNLETFKISAGLNWHSGRPFTELANTQFNSGSILFNEPNLERIDDYVRLDLSARYKFDFTKNVNAEVGASIWNVFDKKNIVNKYYTRDSDNNIIENNEYALGLTPNFSFRLKF